jgi:capsid protein
VEWTTPRFDWVDPVKDVQGEGMEIGLGLKTWAESVRGRGYDPDKVFEDLIAEKERFAKAGITHPMDNVKVKGIGGQNDPPPDQPKN